MNEKQTRLIKLLIKAQDWTTASALSESLGISVRTVKSYVSELNNTYPSIIISSPNRTVVQKILKTDSCEEFIQLFTKNS